MTVTGLFRTPNPSLADITSGGGGIESGDGEKKPADLAAAAQQQATPPAETPATTEKPLIDAAATEITEQEETATEQAEETTEEGSFWDDVDKLRGTPLKVDWSQHTDADGKPIDPVTPQGALIREKVLVEEALQGWEDHLKKADPRGYAYLLHRQAGGTDEEFYSKSTPNLPEYEVFKDSIDLQISLYKKDLLGKGVDEDVVAATIDKVVKDGKIFDKADKIYKDTQRVQEKELKDIQDAQTAAQQEYTNNVNKLNTQLTTKITEGKGLRIIVPEADKMSFQQYVAERVQYHPTEKKFAVMLELGGEDTDRILEAAYLLYKQGDLNKMIKNEANSQNVKKLKRVVEKSKSTNTAATTDVPIRKNVALGELR